MIPGHVSGGVEGGGYSKSITVWGTQYLLSGPSVGLEDAESCVSVHMQVEALDGLPCALLQRGPFITPSQIEPHAKLSPRQMFASAEASG